MSIADCQELCGDMRPLRKTIRVVGEPAVLVEPGWVWMRNDAPGFDASVISWDSILLNDYLVLVNRNRTWLSPLDSH